MYYFLHGRKQHDGERQPNRPKAPRYTTTCRLAGLSKGSCLQTHKPRFKGRKILHWNVAGGRLVVEDHRHNVNLVQRLLVGSLVTCIVPLGAYAALVLDGSLVAPEERVVPVIRV